MYPTLSDLGHVALISLSVRPDNELSFGRCLVDPAHSFPGLR